jgi:hypothetical protein
MGGDAHRIGTPCCAFCPCLGNLCRLPPMHFFVWFLILRHDARSLCVSFCSTRRARAKILSGDGFVGRCSKFRIESHLDACHCAWRLLQHNASSLCVSFGSTRRARAKFLSGDGFVWRCSKFRIESHLDACHCAWRLRLEARPKLCQGEGPAAVGSSTSPTHRAK